MMLLGRIWFILATLLLARQAHCGVFQEGNLFSGSRTQISPILLTALQSFLEKGYYLLEEIEEKLDSSFRLQQGIPLESGIIYEDIDPEAIEDEPEPLDDIELPSSALHLEDLTEEHATLYAPTLSERKLGLGIGESPKTNAESESVVEPQPRALEQSDPVVEPHPQPMALEPEESAHEREFTASIVEAIAKQPEPQPHSRQLEPENTAHGFLALKPQALSGSEFIPVVENPETITKSPELIVQKSQEGVAPETPILFERELTSKVILEDTQLEPEVAPPEPEQKTTSQRHQDEFYETVTSGTPVADQQDESMRQEIFRKENQRGNLVKMGICC